VRSVVNDDAVWFKLLHDYYQHFKYQTIMTTDMASFFNTETGLNLTPIFNQYLRHAAIPTLELRFDDADAAQRDEAVVDHRLLAEDMLLVERQHASFFGFRFHALVAG